MRNDGFGGKEKCLGKPGELCLDGLEVGEIAGAIVDLGVLHDSGFIDEEGGALGHATHDQVFLGEKLIVSNAVGVSRLVVIVRKEFQGNALLLGPSHLREGIVAGDAVDLAVEVGVGSESCGDLTKFLGADAGEGHRDKEKQDVLLSGLLGKGDYFGTTFAESDEGKIRGLIANFDAHYARSIVEDDRMQTGK